MKTSTALGLAIILMLFMIVLFACTHKPVEMGKGRSVIPPFGYSSMCSRPLLPGEIRNAACQI